jgi:exodeoxyribonuclease V alpha subunit
MNYILINYLYKNKYINEIDLAFADLIQRLTGDPDPWAGLAAALVSHITRQGHVCLNLRAEIMDSALAPELSKVLDPFWPTTEVWTERLSDCPAVGKPGAATPLILERDRLYLQRYWSYEQTVAKFLLDRCQMAAVDDQLPALEEMPAGILRLDDRDQQAAVRMAIKERFCVISGGPGTGKTFTLAKIILSLEQLYEERPLRVKLAAPTGKAAARLQEAIEASLEKYSHRPLKKATEKAQTLHRLLAIHPKTGLSRYHAGKPLPADVVIVDEASMIDLSLMAKLVSALAPQARLILSGDKDQLASVEAGAVLGDICWGVRPSDPSESSLTRQDNTDLGLDKHIVLLRRNFRFDTRSGLQDLSQAINVGNAKKTHQLLIDTDIAGISFYPVTNWTEAAVLLENEIRRYLAPRFVKPDAEQMLSQLDDFKILTVVRQGPYGALEMNSLVEKVLARMGLIPSQHVPEIHWYPGRPVMITRNDYFHSLFNGDMGVVVARDFAGDPEPQLRVVFTDPLNEKRLFSTHQLPAHETAYAMTVHKSQGSEFGRVVVVLPDQDSPLLTRELLYTAVTRSRGSVVILGKAELLTAAVGRPIQRSSGLKDMLWPHA